MNIPAFSIAALPRIVFGDGTRRQLPALAQEYGRHALLVTGKASLLDSPAWPELLQGLRDKGVTYQQVGVSGEPSPQLADTLAQQYRDAGIDVVIGMGGGSVLDAAKAVAGLLRVPNSVMDYLEGVGPELPYQGPAVPFIAVPTTAGTGSEATKNAVLSVQGEGGFKKSFRHDTLVAKVAVLDPELLATCPRELSPTCPSRPTLLPMHWHFQASGRRATACCHGISGKARLPCIEPVWLMPRCCQVSRWHRSDWVRCLAWPLRSEPFSRSRMVWSAARWWRSAAR